MVDLKSGLFDNIIEFPGSASKPLSRSAVHADIDMSLDDPADASREGTFPAVDFSLPSFDGENRVVLLIVGFSFVMALFLVSVAFATVSLGFKLLSLLL